MFLPFIIIFFSAGIYPGNTGSTSYLLDLYYIISTIILFILAVIQTNLRVAGGEVKSLRQELKTDPLKMITLILAPLILGIIVIWQAFDIYYLLFAFLVAIFFAEFAIMFSIKFLRDHNDGESIFLGLYWAIAIISTIITIMVCFNIKININ